MSDFTLIATWLVGIVLAGADLVLVLFQALFIVDLQTDEVSPVDFTRKVNKVLMPEFITHVLLTMLFIPHLNWLELVFTIPMLAYNMYLIINKQYRYSPTTVFNKIKRREYVSYFKLAYYLLFIFVLLARLLYFVIMTYGKSKRH
ncbi:ER-derived vesicles protein ERV14 [Entamoeba marina]